MNRLSRVPEWIVRVATGFVATLIVSYVSAAAHESPPGALGADAPVLIAILLDGARWDLVPSNITPNLNRLAKSGVLGEMIPVWPTISTPNHWALATGLYPIHSGPYANWMLNPETGAVFDVNKDYWGRGVPIWAQVKQQGRIAAVIGGWGGVQGSDGTSRSPSYYIPYEDSCAHCAEIALSLVDQDAATRPQLLAIYSAEPDSAEHLYGVGSPQAQQAIQAIDQMVGRLSDGLKVRGLAGKVDVIILSDHGQTNLPKERNTAYVEDFVGLDDLIVPPTEKRTPWMGLWPRPGKEAHVYRMLQHAGPHFHVFRPKDLPDRWHCCDAKRVPPVILTSDPGWSWGTRQSTDPDLVGMHGYDNSFKDMHALFIANGPAFKAGTIVGPFENVDVFSLMAELLHVKPAPSDGSINALCTILVSPPSACENSP
jgi:predicted AlkP superfamily pyrophosphatase or phosphodiesterase